MFERVLLWAVFLFIAVRSTTGSKNAENVMRINYQMLICDRPKLESPPLPGPVMPGKHYMSYNATVHGMSLIRHHSHNDSVN